MISLKKSFELQNYLRSIFGYATDVLTNNKMITTTVQKHYRSKAWSEAQDEETTVPKPTDYTFTINQLVEFVEYLTENITTLTSAINRAKGDKYDTLLANNNSKRRMLTCMLNMTGVKPTKTVTTGHSTRFNNDGNQVQYAYDIEEVKTIDFNRDVVKAIITRLRRELDESSQEIDNMALNTMVDYDNVFEIGENLEDAVARWIELTGQKSS